MNFRDHSNTLLKIIAEELPPGVLEGGVPELDNNDECFLTLDGNIVIMFYLEEDSRSLILNLPLGPLPTGAARENAMLELLRANYSWNLTEGATLGVDRETDIICLSYLVPLPLAEPTQITVIINKLASVAVHWRRTLEEISSDAADEAPSGPAFEMLRA